MKILKMFSFESYRHMLSEMKDAGFKVSSFQKFDTTAPKTVIMRHDIDYTLDGASIFARIEADLGISASYLFRVHADEYNIFGCRTYKLLRELQDLGHEIGLHFEAMNVGRALGLHPPDLLKKEKHILETVIGQVVETCAEHRDYSNMIHQTAKFEDVYGREQIDFKFFAMDPAYCREMKYLSESNANWREGDPLQHLTKYNRFQILAHPDWWFESDLLLKGHYRHPQRDGS